MATLHPSSTDRRRDPQYSRAVRTTFGVVAIVTVLAAVVSAATLWLLLTDPVVAAEASASGDLVAVFQEVLFVVGRALKAAVAYL